MTTFKVLQPSVSATPAGAMMHGKEKKQKMTVSFLDSPVKIPAFVLLAVIFCFFSLVGIASANRARVFTGPSAVPRAPRAASPRTPIRSRPRTASRSTNRPGMYMSPTTPSTMSSNSISKTQPVGVSSSFSKDTRPRRSRIRGALIPPKGPNCVVASPKSNRRWLRPVQVRATSKSRGAAKPSVLLSSALWRVLTFLR